MVNGNARRRWARVLLAAGVCGLNAAAWAQNSTWGNTGTQYSTPANWNNGVPGTTSQGVFLGTPVNQPNLTGSATIGSLDFQSAGWTFTGSRLAMNGGGTGIASAVSTTGSPTGAVTFNNAFGMGANAAWSNSLNITFNGQLDTGGGTSNGRNWILNNTGEINVAGGYVLVGSSATIASPFLRTVTFQGTGSINLSSNVSDSLTAGMFGALRTESTGQITLTGNNSFTGGTQINAGTIAFDGDESFGAVPGVLDTDNIAVTGNSSLRLISGSGAVTLHQRRGILIGGTGGRTLTIDVPGTTDTLTLDGPIAETTSLFGRLAKVGGGTLVLNAASTHSASSNFSAGTVVFNNNSAVGTGSLVLSGAVVILSGNGPRTINNELRVSGTHTVAGSQNFTFAGPVVHTGTTNRTINIFNTGVTTYANTVTLTNSTNAGDRVWTFQSNGGELIFSQPIVNGPGGIGSVTFSKQGLTTINGNNTYTGLTTINNGTVRMNGTHSPAGAYTVNSGTLAGSGTIAASVTVTDNAAIAPGNSVGTLRANSFDLQPASTYAVEVNFNEVGPSIADKLISTGPSASVTLGDGVSFPTLQFSFVYDGAISVPQTIVIIQNDAPTNTTTGQFDGLAQNASVSDGVRTYSIDYAAGDGNDVAVTFTVVPEPGSLLWLASAALLHRRRRASNRNARA